MFARRATSYPGAMLDQELRRDAQVRPDQDQEVPQSEHALLSNSGIAEMAAEERAAGPMSRDEALAVITSGPVAPLPHRAVVEQRLGADLSQVRAHLGPDVARALQVLGAEAVTIGQHVGFADDSVSVETVAHEAAHVLQARGGKRAGEAADEAQAEQVERGGDAGALVAPSMQFDEVKPGGPEGQPEVRRKAVIHDDLDPAAIEKDGVAAGQGDLSVSQIAKAIAFNDRKWQAGQRSQLLGYLRGGEVTGGSFAEGDVEKAAKLQRGAGIDAKSCDGMIGDTTMAILLHAGFAFDFDDKVRVRPSDVQLVFYPGEFEDLEAWKAAAEKAVEGHEGDPTHNIYRATEAPPGTGRMYVKWKGNLVDVIECRGGPPMKLKDDTHSADPSKAGTYTLGAKAPHRTDNWYMSQIRWGAKLRERDDGEIEFQDPGATSWKIASGPDSQLRSPMQRGDFFEGGTLMAEWRLNDFGAAAYRIQGSPGLFIHTSPQDEETVLSGGTPVLTHSHGCLHVNPAERQRLEGEGFLQGGVQLVVKGYDVNLLPKGMRDKMQDEG